MVRTEELQELTSELSEMAHLQPAIGCLHYRFEKQAAETPDAVAVLHGADSMTYAELNARSQKIEAHLRGLGIGPESLVGVFTDRSMDMIVAIFGILKAGAAYVPLDPKYPAARIKFMLEDTNVGVVLTQSKQLDKLPEHSATALCLDKMDDWVSGATVASTPQAEPSNLAYIIYTSGSTGRPKGVAIEHRSAVAFVDWALTQYTREEIAVTLASASICFDFSIFELFVPLSAGGAVRLVDNALSLQEASAASDVTFINMVPSAMAEVIRDYSLPKSVRVVNLGGEELPVKLAQRIYSRTAVKRIVNIYGPTECTVCATTAAIPVDVEGSCPIGLPILGTKVYVLDTQQNLVAMGVPGELYIGGAGMARGYLNRPELTAEKFVSNPFSSDPNERLYRTGDLVRRRQDGQLEFLGRLDQQIKLRGFRIELGEIEAVLSEHPSVEECVVTVREDIPGDQRLVAYAVAAAGQTLDPHALREHARLSLPDHMVPWPFVPMDSLPVTESGKLNRKALPAPTNTSDVCFERDCSHEDDALRTLHSIWIGILGIKNIGVNDNFFDLGGYSLLAIRLLRRVNQEFETNLTLAEVFKAPTISAMSDLIQSKISGRSQWSPVVAFRTGGHRLPLFFAPVGGGSAFYYRTLSRTLCDDRPHYGFEPVGMNGVDRPHETVEEMAAYYIEHMRQIQPVGPYHICGLSYGGMIAFEIARQLTEAGQSIGCLIMFDSDAPGYERELETVSIGSLRRTGRNMKFKLSSYKEDFFLRRDLSERVRYVYSRLARLPKRVGEQVGGNQGSRRAAALADLPSEFEEVRQAEERSRRHYRPGQYTGKIHLLRARLQPLGHFIDPNLGWSKYAKTIHAIETPGTHQSMLEEPCVHVAAEHIRKILEGTVDVVQRNPVKTLKPALHASK